MTFPLYLDGIYWMSETMKKHGYQLDYFEDVVLYERFKYKSYCLRVSIIVHALLLTIRTATFQSCRGIGTFLVGICTLEKRKIDSGMRDFLSLIVQILVLPLLGICCACFSKSIFQLLQSLLETFDSPRHKGLVIEKRESETYQKVISGVIRGCFAVPAGIIDTVLFMLIALLSGDVNELKEVGLRFLFTIISPFLGIGVGLSRAADRTVARLFWIDKRQEVSGEIWNYI